MTIPFQNHMSLTLTGFFTEVKSALLFFSSYSAQDDKAYDLTLSSLGKIPVYCHMSNSGLGECGGGGWTLVMKIDGTKVRLGIESRPSFPCLQFLSDCFFFFAGYFCISLDLLPCYHKLTSSTAKQTYVDLDSRLVALVNVALGN